MLSWYRFHSLRVCSIHRPREQPQAHQNYVTCSPSCMYIISHICARMCVLIFFEEKRTNGWWNVVHRLGYGTTSLLTYSAALRNSSLINAFASSVTDSTLVLCFVQIACIPWCAFLLHSSRSGHRYTTWPDSFSSQSSSSPLPFARFIRARLPLNLRL